MLALSSIQHPTPINTYQTTQPQSGSTQPQSGSTQPQSGSTQSQSGSTQSQSGSTQPQSGSTQPQSGSTQPQSGSTQPQSGSTQSQSVSGEDDVKISMDTGSEKGTSLNDSEPKNNDIEISATPTTLPTPPVATFPSSIPIITSTASQSTQNSTKVTSSTSTITSTLDKGEDDVTEDNDVMKTFEELKNKGNNCVKKVHVQCIMNY